MFWVPALFVVVIIVHVIIVAVLVVKERPLPDLLQPPRLELMLSFFVLPPISIAAAGLFRDSRSTPDSRTAELTRLGVVFQGMPFWERGSSFQSRVLSSPGIFSCSGSMS